MLDRDALVCPAGSTCTAVAGTNGMYVRGTNNHIYLSPHGYERFTEGEDTNWAGVARDLLRIAGGSIGGVAPGVLGMVVQALGIGDYAIDCWFNDNC
jgi:hypothetical protein